MPSYFNEAGQAIGSVVAVWHSKDAHNWGKIVPADRWGMNVAAWDQMLRDIVREFRSLIDPCDIRDGERFSGARKQELYILQRRMADSVVCPGDDDDGEDD